MRFDSSMRRRGELEQTIALDAARRDIAGRIRRVCEHFAADEFEQLVDRMATIDVKYRLRDAWGGTLSDATERSGAAT